MTDTKANTAGQVEPEHGVPAIFCRCASGCCVHKSDCEVHNEPAEEAGSCTCLSPAEKRALPGAHYSDGRRYSYISNAWIFAEDWNDREEVARLTSRLAALSQDLAAARARAERAEKDAERLEAEMRALVNQLRMPSMGGRLTMDARAQLIAAEAVLLDPPIRARRRDLITAPVAAGGQKP